jgi:hypothetical protein
MATVALQLAISKHCSTDVVCHLGGRQSVECRNSSPVANCCQRVGVSEGAQRSAQPPWSEKCIELLSRRGRAAPSEVHGEYLAVEQQCDFVARKQAENRAFAACFVQ